MTPGELSANSLKRIADTLDKLVLHLISRTPAPPGQEIASDTDLDGQYGDPIIKRDPRDWQGDSFANCHMSEAPAHYLDLLASFFAWKAEKNAEDAVKPEKSADEKSKHAKYAKYGRIDAARARGWAQRKRAGWRSDEAPRGPAEEDLGGDSEERDLPY